MDEEDQSSGSPQTIVEQTQRWLRDFVIGLNLCPFAGRELASNSVRFVVSNATTAQKLLSDLLAEIKRLDDDPQVETTLLIHPSVLQEFYDYNDFLDQADRLLKKQDREGVYQIASFHPCYQFADTEADDVENYTNRSPYPMLHLLRESSLERAISNHPDTAKIPAHNIALLRSLGKEKIRTMIGQNNSTTGETD